MASCITSMWVEKSTTCPQVRLTVTQSSYTDSTVTLSYKLEYVCHGYASNGTNVGRPYWIYIDGEEVSTGTFIIHGITDTRTITTGTTTVYKSTSERDVSFSVTFDFSLSWSDIYCGKRSASGSIGISAVTSYKISYSANGGSGAPSSQTKWHGSTLKLSSSTPTRTGYTFENWNTKSDGSGTYYSPGGNYTSNSAVTLYAIWQIITYTITYNANGGSFSLSSQTKTYGATAKITTDIPTRTNYTFKGWATSSTATTVSYAAGSSYTANAHVTLYAVWELAYVSPRIASLSASRCLSDGTISDTGTYAYVKFWWETDQTVASVTIEWKPTTSGVWSSTTTTASGTTGTLTKVAGNGNLDAETSYSMRVTVTDSLGSTSALTTLHGTHFTIDVMPGGRGVSFGKPAELNNFVEFNYYAQFDKPVYGKALGLDKLPQIPKNSDLNDYMEPGCYAVYRNDEAATMSNIPVARAGRLEVWSATGEGLRTAEWSYLRQRFVPYNKDNAVWERDITRNKTNVWTYGDWWRSTLTPAASSYVYSGQKVLWGADRDIGYYMNSTQVANLSEPISNQSNGIVLVFCVYYSDTDTNYAYQSFFVPKQLVALLPGKTHTFTMNRVTFGAVAAKQLLIADTQISGNDYNDDTGTASASGITYANNKFVLRYVIGV